MQVSWPGRAIRFGIAPPPVVRVPTDNASGSTSGCSGPGVCDGPPGSLDRGQPIRRRSPASGAFDHELDLAAGGGGHGDAGGLEADLLVQRPGARVVLVDVEPHVLDGGSLSAHDQTIAASKSAWARPVPRASGRTKTPTTCVCATSGVCPK